VKFLNWHHWGIKTRTLVISILQLGMIFSVILWFYLTRLNEIDRDLQDQGNLVARIMAIDSQYGVISGNLSDLESTILRLLQSNRSIYSIDILEATGKQLLHVSSGVTLTEMTRTFEADIRKDQVDLNSFGINDAPHVSEQLNLRNEDPHGGVVGKVRVAMTPTSMLANKHNRLLTGTAIALAFLLVTSLVAFEFLRSLTRPLATAIAAVRRIRTGNYQTELQITAGGEVAELQSSIIEMAASLDESKRNLEGRVLARTEELAKARDAEVKANAEKRRLIQKVTTAVEEERQNIAFDIHDHLNASVIAVRLDIQRLLRHASNVQSRMAECVPADDKSTKEMDTLIDVAKSSLQYLSDLYERARGIVKRLRPEVLDTLGLRDAVDDMVRHFDESHPNCRFEFRAAGEFSSVNNQVAIASYRLVQEALSNIDKHAAASITRVVLNVDDEEETLSIEVLDNGKGFNAANTEPGIGMIGMRERVFGLNGKLDIASEVGAGTTIRIELPLEKDGDKKFTNVSSS